MPLYAGPSTSTTDHAVVITAEGPEYPDPTGQGMLRARCTFHVTVLSPDGYR
ncbi:hypothetical protein ACWCZ5_16935 [Streptomyces sp. NPDC001667]